jgi:hypothetical protein
MSTQHAFCAIGTKYLDEFRMLGIISLDIKIVFTNNFIFVTFEHVDHLNLREISERCIATTSERWKRHIPPKRRSAFNILHGGIGQTRDLFITTAVRT